MKLYLKLVFYFNIGASFVTKKEEDDDPLYFLPENVGAFNGRLHVTKGKCKRQY